MGYRRVETVSDHLIHGVPLAILCQACGHYGEMNAADIPWNHPSNVRPEQLPFRCSHCGAHGDRLAHGKEARYLYFSKPPAERGRQRN